MKRILMLTLFIPILTFSAFSQEDGKLSASEVQDVIVVDSDSINEQTPVLNVEEITNHVIQTLTNNDEVKINPPDKLNPVSPESIKEWYGFIVALIAPFLTYLLARFWPSNTKRELTLKGAGVAIVVVVVFIVSKGEFNFNAILQALISIVMAPTAYDKIYKPLGMESKKTYK